MNRTEAAKKIYGEGLTPEFWQSVREKPCYDRFRKDLFDMWQKNCENIPIYALKYSDFRLFVVNGNRSIYENTYFTRRRALDCAALLALLYPEEEKYLVRLMDEIYAICDEYTWCLPAHQTKLEINNNIHLDLFASETGFALAEIDALLGDRLEPLIRDRIRVEIDRRILTAYTNGTHYWWEHGTNNWSAVCMGSVGGTMMLMHPELVEELLPRFNETMEGYLRGFADDGICTEGCGYWHYGFGFFTVYADMIRRFTDGKVDYFRREKVKNIATFIQKMFLSGRSSVSFSDGGRSVSYQLGLCHYLKKEYPDVVKVYSPEYSYHYDGCGRFCLQLRSALWCDEEIYNNPAGAEANVEYFEEGAQWFIKRTPAYGFAAKGGNNGESHNHNDIGTFIFAKDGRQMISDLGGGPYTRQYFAADTRYTTYIECSALGHNIPTFDGIAEKEGGKFAARDVKYENGVFSLDFSGAYDTDRIRAAKRAFSFTPETVTVSDEFDFDGAIEERLVSLVEPELGNGEVTIDGAVVTFDPSFCEVSKDSVVRDGRTICHITHFRLADGVKKFSFTVR